MTSEGKSSFSRCTGWLVGCREDAVSVDSGEPYASYASACMRIISLL